MPSQTVPANSDIFDVSDQDVDAAIATCDGDSRATIRALLVAYAMLERHMSLAASRVARRGQKARVAS